MATRHEADKMYQSIGYAGFSAAIAPAEVIARADVQLSPHEAGHVRRIAHAVKNGDPDEYFELSEYATSPESVMMLTDQLRGSTINSIAVVVPSDMAPGINRLFLAPAGGHVHNKYRQDPHYSYTLMSWVARYPTLRRNLAHTIQNVPQSALETLLSRVNCLLFYPTKLANDKYEEEPWVDAVFFPDDGIVQRLWNLVS